MPTQVTLTISEGTDKGKTFTFLAHDTFVLGRNPDCLEICLHPDRRDSEGGSVWDFMQKQGDRLPLAIAKPIMLDALQGVP